MKSRKAFLLIMSIILVILVAGVPAAVTGETVVDAAEGAPLKEMPVLKGDTWQKMSHDEKVAFVWGVGHMLSIERNFVAIRPGKGAAGLSCTLAEGLAGISMNDIVSDIDTFYRENQDDLAAPVIAVIWDEIAQPRLKKDTATR